MTQKRLKILKNILVFLKNGSSLVKILKMKTISSKMATNISSLVKILKMKTISSKMATKSSNLVKILKMKTISSKMATKSSSLVKILKMKTISSKMAIKSSNSSRNRLKNPKFVARDIFILFLSHYEALLGLRSFVLVLYYGYWDCNLL
jgi:hypothetical protein